jgi:hypothetical protein
MAGVGPDESGLTTAIFVARADDAAYIIKSNPAINWGAKFYLEAPKRRIKRYNNYVDFEEMAEK